MLRDRGVNVRLAKCLNCLLNVKALIQVRTSYLPHEILWGYQFRHNCVQFDSEEQKYEVSFDSFNDIVKDDTPRQDISNMLIKFSHIKVLFI